MSRCQETHDFEDFGTWTRQCTLDDADGHKRHVSDLGWWETSQPAPTANSSTPIIDLVTADLLERSRVGEQRYGTLLQAHNGRDALRDAYEEAMDLAMYLRQLIAERDAPIGGSR